MMLTRTTESRVIGAFTLLAAFVLSASQVCAQQPSSADSLQTLMEHRQDLSRRAVEETKQRRFEEGRSDSSFPSDNANAAKRGVIPALTPQQQKALKYNERGLELFSKGQFDGAMKEYQEAIRSDPKLAAAHNNLGSAYFASGRFEEAATAFRLACELDPDYGQAFFNLALSQIKLGHEKEANETLNAALRAYNSTGEAQLKAGHFKEAEEAFLGMLQIDPEYAPALLRLGLVYNFAKRYAEAAQFLHHGAERDPANAAAHELLAEALYGEQKYEEAAVSAERALKLSPNHPDALYFAGLARASLGQRDAALIHLDKLRRLNSPELTQRLLDFINQKATVKP
jgi:tetratricopeptide (TPR) repeat protein